MKRLLIFTTLLLCSLLTFAQFSGTVSDSQGVQYTANDDESTCYVSGHESNFSATIVIPEVYEGRHVTAIIESAFWECKGLTSVTIPEGVTSVGKTAFANCENLISITIPSSVTSIGRNAFQQCSGLTEVTIPNGITSIGIAVFSGCSSLTSVTIPSSVTSIGEFAFRGCSDLTSVTIPSGVTSIGGEAFSGCGGLTSIIVEEGNTVYDSRDNCNAIIRTDDNTLIAGCKNTVIPSSVTSIAERAFYNCSGLTSLTIPSSVTSIGNHAFDGCSGLTSVTIPSSVTSIGGYAFWHCSSLTSVTIPEGVTSIGNYTFASCSGLTSVTIPSSVTSIGNSAFNGCSGLTSVTIPSSVTSIGEYAFASCSGLTSVTIPKGVTSIGERAFLDCSSLTSVTIPEGVTSTGERTFERCSSLTSVTIPSSVTSIGGYAFWHCISLTSVTIPSSVTSIGKEAFWGCSGLTSLTIPSSVTSIGNSAFSGCSGLTSLTISEGVTSIGESAFDGLKGLTSLTIPSSVTSIGKSAFAGWKGLTSLVIPSSVTLIGEGAFQGCSGLMSIIVEEGNTVYDSRNNCNAIIRTSDNSLIQGCNNTVIPSDVASIGESAFSGCSGLTSVSIPEGVTSIVESAFYGCSGLTSVTIPEGVTSIGDDTFYGCSGLTSVSIPEGVTSIGESAFTGCSGLTSVTIPEGVTSIGESAFTGCSGLTSVTIPEGVMSIGDFAFSGCSGLTSVTIPSSVTSIGDYAFGSCSGLTSVTIPSSVTSIGRRAFSRCSGLTSVIVGWDMPLGIDGSVFSNSNYNNATLYVPKGTKAAYEAAAVWLDFGDIKEKLDISDGAVSDSQGIRYTANDDESTCYVSGHDDTYSSDIIIPRIFKGRHVTSIGAGTFSGCSNLTSLTVRWGTPIAIDGSVFDGSNCHNAVLRVPVGSKAAYDVAEGWNDFGEIVEVFTEGQTSDSQGVIYKAYYEDELICRVVGHEDTYSSTIIIPEFYKGSRVTSIDESAFYNCRGLTSVTIPSSVTSIGNGAFAGCNGLTSIVVESGNMVYDSRDNCNAIVRTSDNTLIAGCRNTVIPASVTSIGDWAFYNCSGLTSVTIPEGVTSISDWAFRACSGLTSVTIPSSVTSIGIWAFISCKGLTSVSIPEGVTSIGESAFEGCSGLTSVIVGWETPLEINNIFSRSNYNNATLYVPKGTKAAYEAEAVWQDFGAIFEGDLPQENVELTDASAIDNVIYMEPIEATKGREVTVSLRMKNTAGIRGFQFDMQLPLGVTVAKDGNDRFVCSLNDKRQPSGSAHTLTVSEQQDGAVRFLCGSQYDETFTGSDGEILTVRLCLDEHMLDGQYPIVLKDVKLTETNINNYYETATVQTAMTVIAYTPGDISGDGIIDVSDYIGVANYILGTPQEGIIVAAADVNKDNLVDVSDYIGVANLILYNNIYGQTVSASRSVGHRRVNTDVSTLDNVIYISPFEAASNGETQVSIRMKNTVGIRGFQFDLYLPDGMTAVKDGNNRFVSTLSNGRKPNGDQHTLTLSEQQDGAIRFLCGSQYDETFTGTDGEIATLTINVDAGVEAQDYPIYLRNMKLTETDINNFYTTDEIETSVTVTGPADNRVLLSETSTTAPEAASNVDVRVKRTINANEWSTICLPFAMTTEQVQTAFGNDVELGDFNDYTPTYDGDNLLNISVNFVEATAIEANHPYVIKVSESISEFTVDGVTIEPEDVPCVSFGYETGKKPVVYHPADFIGTYVADFDFYNDASKRAIFLSGNKFYYATANTRHMKAFRAYFDFDDVLTDAENAASRIRMSLDDETTSISDATRLNDNGKMINDNYYGLDGRKLTKRPTKKGVYVRGGRKVIIK